MLDERRHKGFLIWLAITPEFVVKMFDDVCGWGSGVLVLLQCFVDNLTAVLQAGYCLKTPAEPSTLQSYKRVIF